MFLCVPIDNSPVNELNRLLSNLGEDSTELKDKFLELIKEDGEITEDEIRVLVNNIELVMKVIDGLSEIIPDDMKREAIKRIALYLSIEHIRRINIKRGIPQCMQELVDALPIDDDFRLEALKIISGLREKDTRVADVFLSKIACMFGKKERVEKVRKYLYLRQETAKRLKIDPMKVSPVRDVAESVNRYLRDRSNGEKIVDVVVRYLLGERFGDKTDGILERIKSMRQLQSETSPAEIDPNPLGVFRAGLGEFTVYSTDTIILQHVSIYLSGNPDWDEDNIDNMTVNVIKNLASSGRIMFMYDKEDEKERFVKLLVSKGINPGTIICGRYEDIKTDLEGRRVVTVIKDKDERFRGEDTIVTDGGKVVDLYLMWKVTFLFAQFGKHEDFKDNLKSFLKKYYKDTKYEKDIDSLVEEMFSKDKWIVLPPIVPFVSDYYEVLSEVRKLIEHSA